MTRESRKKNVPIIAPRAEIDVSYLLEHHDGLSVGDRISEIEVRPGEQTHISLGDYDPANMPKGFDIALHPSIEDGDIIRQITRLEHQGVCELVLHIANYNDKTVSIKVCIAH